MKIDKNRAIPGIAIALLMLAPIVHADQMSMQDFVTNSGYIDDVKKVGLTFLSMQYPVEKENTYKNFHDNYWAMMPDVHLSNQAKESQRVQLDAAVDEATQTITDYAPRELILAGVDRLATWKCMDWYYMGITRKGPLLIRVSIIYVDRPRIIQFEMVTDWDKIKDKLSKVQMPVTDRALTMELKEPTTRP